MECMAWPNRMWPSIYADKIIPNVPCLQSQPWDVIRQSVDTAFSAEGLGLICLGTGIEDECSLLGSNGAILCLDIAKSTGSGWAHDPEFRKIQEQYWMGTIHR